MGRRRRGPEDGRPSRERIACPARVSWLSCLAERVRAAAGHPAESAAGADRKRSEEHTSELQSLMRISYAVFCLKKKKTCYVLTRASMYVMALSQPTLLMTHETLIIYLVRSTTDT